MTPLEAASLIKQKSGFPLLLCLIPIAIYFGVFGILALNANYVAFDDILILGVIPNFGTASPLAKWKLLTELFPEHRLVFSRSVILSLYAVFGKVNLIWAMVISNICWTLCLLIYYKVFNRLAISLWYFVPVVWLWFNIQSYENMLWGVSSLCNFGVILFALCSIYLAVYQDKQTWLALFFAVLATFSYGNGLMVFPVLAFIFLVTGRFRALGATLLTVTVISVVYFIDFKPITKSLDLSNPEQIKQGILGFMGFMGSNFTIAAWGITNAQFYTAVIAGLILIGLFLLLFFKNRLLESIVQRKPYRNQAALFGFAVALFIAITGAALTYKRIPVDAFEGMFKGRYRMYSTMLLIALYFVALSTLKSNFRKKYLRWGIPSAMALNLLILHANFGGAVNNRRMAIVQEFNARYNSDWIGLRMFSMTQEHFEKVRRYYNSDDPLATGWNPRSESISIPCENSSTSVEIDTLRDNLVAHLEWIPSKKQKDFSDGPYVLLKSTDHVYAMFTDQRPVPFKTTVRRGMYFEKHVNATLNQGAIAPGNYTIYLLIRENGQNRIFCTGKNWEKTD